MFSAKVRAQQEMMMLVKCGDLLMTNAAKKEERNNTGHSVPVSGKLEIVGGK